MIFFAQSSQNQTDLIIKEAERAGADKIKATTSGVQFSGSLLVGYRFTLTTRISSRVLNALYFDQRVKSSDELYEKCKSIPWEEYLTPEKTFQITQTVQGCNWLKNTHFASLRVKDAIVDRIREKFNDERPSVDTANPDLTFHLHIKGDKVIIYLDFSGEGLFKRGYRSDSTDAILKEHLASACIYRSEWYKSVEDGTPLPLLDPFCGSGTLAVEAALIARDIAPGLIRKTPYAFEKLPSFDSELYEKVLNELSDKAEEAKKRDVKIYASDISRSAVEISKAAALKAGVYSDINFEIKDFTSFTADDVKADKGCIITDPPYGVRLKESSLEKLYYKLGEVCQSYFKGWKISILCGESELLSQIDMKPDRTNSLYNGGILCQLAHYSIFTEEEKQELIQRAIKKREERLSIPLSAGAQMAYNRIKKNLDSIKPLMEKEGVTCYRVYDADMPEYSAAIDIYENKWINLQEYAPPASINKEDAERRLNELVNATERATGIELENIYIKQRKEQKGKEQYKKLASKNKFYIARENGIQLLVNFSDYLDTGIFLDHRPIRKFIQENSKDKRFLNLFCYTATASLNAVKGGALSTTNIDASSTYLDWAMENFKLNGYSTDIGNFFYKSDAFDFLWNTFDRYDLIFCDPPTFSNSKSRETFDVQRDHARLIEASMMHLEKSGMMIFSNNFRRFKLDDYLYDKYSIEEITKQTIGDDFKRDERIHKCYIIKHKIKIDLTKKTYKLKY